MMRADAPRIVLASGSATRAAMLARAGVPVASDPPDVDEDAVKADGRARGLPAAAVAEALAERKAARVGTRHPGALVIGADQMLECGGAWFDKPVDSAGARAQLEALAGRTHRLISSVAVVRDREIRWRHTDSAELEMRPLSTAFLDRYLAEVGAGAQHSVGAYQLEGLGAQLFARIEGDFFTILGLPLLPLLAFLRAEGALLA